MSASSPLRSRSLSLCIFSHSSNLCGAERSLLDLTKVLVQDHGVICTVVLPFHGPLEDELTHAGASCIIVPYNWWCWSPGVPPLTGDDVARLLGTSAAAVVGMGLTALRNIDPDVIMTMTMVIPWGAITAALLNRPHVWHVCEFGQLDHGLHFARQFEEILDTIRDASAVVMTITEAQRRVLFPALRDEECVPLYRHIEIPPSDAIEPQTVCFKRPGAARLAMFATIQEGKGQEDAVKAVAELVHRGHEVELLLAGHADSHYLARLDRLIQEHALEPYVLISGFIPDVYDAMRQADIVLVCSRHEAFGRVAVEASLLGKAIVYSGSGALPEYMQDGKTGLAYQAGNVPELVDRIETLLAHPEEARALGDKARSHAQTRFARSSFGDRAYEIFMRARDAGSFFASAPGRRIMPLLSEMIQHALSVKEAEIAQLRPTVSAQHAQLEKLHRHLDTQNEELALLRPLVSSQHTQLEELRRQVHAQDEELARLRPPAAAGE